VSLSAHPRPAHAGLGRRVAAYLIDRLICAGFRYAIILLALLAMGSAQLSDSALEKKSEEIQLLLRTGKFDEAEPLARECIRQRPEEIYFLAPLEIVLNGQGKFGEADALRDRIRKLWKKDYKAEWIAKGSPVGESSWARVLSFSKEYEVVGAEYFVPRLLEGSDRKDPLALIAYYKVIALPKSGNGPSRIFQLDKSAIEKAYFLEEFSKQAITLAKTYGNGLPELRTVVADAIAYLDEGSVEGSAEEVKQLEARIVELYGEARYEEAIPVAQQALAIREKERGPDHPDTARSLNNLALLYEARGAYAKAEPLLERALAITERVLGPDHPNTAKALANLAWLYQDSGEYAKAEPLYQRALATTERMLGPDHPDTATILDNLALLYEASGAYAKAEPLCQRALAIREKALGPEHPDTAIALGVLARLYMDTGANAKAEPLFERALAIHEKALGPEHPDTATSLADLASLYQDTGADAKAEPLFERALAIYEKALGPEHPYTASSLNSLALLYHRRGAYAKAEPMLERALAVYEKTLGPEHPSTANVLNSLAALYQETGAPAKVEPLLQRALEINENTLGPEHPDTATALGNLAWLYQDTGAYAKAETLLERAVAINEKAKGPDHPQTAHWLNNLALLYQATGTYLKAESLYRRAQVSEENNAVRSLLSGSEARKQAYLRERAASVWVNISFSLAHPTAGTAALGLTSVLQYKGRVLDSISGSVTLLRRSAAPEDQTLFDQLSSIAQEFSTLTFAGPGKRSSEAFRQRLNELAQQQEKLEAELSTRSAVLRQAVTPITLESVRQALPADAVLVEWFRYQPFDPKTKVDAHWGAPRYVAYVLKRSSEPVAIDAGAAQPIEKLVAEFRTALSDPASTYFKDVAEELSEKLVRPLRPYWADSQRLLLSPDGALNLVPFAALVDEHGEYLAQHFELTYFTSGRDLLRMGAEPSPRGSSVILADPNYGTSASKEVPVDNSLYPTRSGDLDRSGLVFAPLPGTATEAKLLQSLLHLDEQNLLTGDRATEASLRELHGPRILHVATHGFFLNDHDVAAVLRPGGFGRDAPPLPLGENPLLRSGLALAGANARHSGVSDDGILTAAEVAQLDLVGTQLVVLSACDTGVGTVQNGEGVYGLRRALVLAGAQSQLVSLWNVADAPTQELMLDYYQRLLKGEGRSAALRASQLVMLANPERQHPYYWAGFIPIGQWTPLTSGR
jgi:CHAT domain-containing protein/Tfp pilus assembly protein PilF